MATEKPACGLAFLRSTIFELDAMPRLSILAALAILLASCASEPERARRIERLDATAAAAMFQPILPAVTPEEIIGMTKMGKSADEIIAHIRSRDARYQPSAKAIVDLANSGVTMKVLDHLLDADRRRIHDDAVSEAMRRERACLERLEAESRLCRPAPPPLIHPGYPLGSGWPQRFGPPCWCGL